MILCCFSAIKRCFLKKEREISFDTHGFLSPGMEQFRISIKKVPAFKAWFDFADELNQLGLDMLRDRDIPRDDNQRLTISVLFVRAHKSFQAALILAEMGLISDARTVLRSAIEGAIALNALANDQKFLDQLINAHHFNQRKSARLLLNDPNYRTLCAPEQIVEMEATINQVDAMETTANKKLSDINWCDVAVKHCKDLYQLLYRLLSSDGTHTTINAIHRHVAYDANDRITDLKIGPDTADLVDTLKAACLTFLWAADPFARAFDLNEISGRIEKQIQRFAELPQDEPCDVTVVSTSSNKGKVATP